MNQVNCRTLYESKDATFEELESVIVEANQVVESFREKEKAKKRPLLELPDELLLLLNRLDVLTTQLSDRTKSQTNVEQRKHLCINKQAIAKCFCVLQHIVSAIDEKEKTAGDLENFRKQAKYYFFEGCSYEMRTPINLIRGYAQLQEMLSETDEADQFFNQIYTAPFVPKHQSILDEIKHCADELITFMNSTLLQYRSIPDKVNGTSISSIFRNKKN